MGAMRHTGISSQALSRVGDWKHSGEVAVSRE